MVVSQLLTKTRCHRGGSQYEDTREFFNSSVDVRLKTTSKSLWKGRIRLLLKINKQYPKNKRSRSRMIYPSVKIVLRCLKTTRELLMSNYLYCKILSDPLRTLPLSLHSTDGVFKAESKQTGSSNLEDR